MLWQHRIRVDAFRQVEGGANSRTRLCSCSHEQRRSTATNLTRGGLPTRAEWLALKASQNLKASGADGTRRLRRVPCSAEVLQIPSKTTLVTAKVMEGRGEVQRTAMVHSRAYQPLFVRIGSTPKALKAQPTP
jgi:hypothetical protein